MASRATAAQKAEATREMLSFEYDGYTYHAPAKWDLDVLEAWEDDAVAKTMRLSVGPAEYREFRRTHSTQDELSDFFSAYNDALNAKN